jgi:tRNA/tmRNA/rRNA uracil-C5-methylase (TrmA/RlmC/RlmD family)
MKVGDLLELSVTRLGHDGVGVGEAEDREVHVRGLFPGEAARVRVDHVERQRPRAYASVAALTDRLPGRRPVPCIRHERVMGGVCGGCPLLDVDADTGRALKLEAVRSLGLAVERIEFDESAPDGLAYRWSSKRVAGIMGGALVLGSRMHRGERVAPMRGCLVDHPLVASAFDELEQEARTLGIVACIGDGGDLRFAWAKTNGSEVLLTLITANQESRAAAELPARLKVPAGIAWAVQGAGGNAMRTDTFQILRGVGELPLRVFGAPATVGPLEFLQPNPRVAMLAYRALTENADGSPLAAKLAFDLYAGSGATTALLRRGADEVRPCESSPQGAERLGVPPESTEDFLARALLENTRPDLVIANPPRAGLETAAASLATLRAPAIRIMSCNAETLARDLAVLAPHYTVEWVRAFDTLPQTAHVELVVSLRLR